MFLRHVQTLHYITTCPRRPSPAAFPQRNPLICRIVSDRSKDEVSHTASILSKTPGVHTDGNGGAEPAQRGVLRASRGYSPRPGEAPNGSQPVQIEIRKSCLGQE